MANSNCIYNLNTIHSFSFLICEVSIKYHFHHKFHQDNYKSQLHLTVSIYLNKKDKKKSNSILTKQNKVFLKSLRTNTFDYNTLRGLKKKIKPKLINVFKKSQLLLNKWKRLNEVE